MQDCMSVSGEELIPLSYTTFWLLNVGLYLSVRCRTIYRCQMYDHIWVSSVGPYLGVRCRTIFGGQVYDHIWVSGVQAYLVIRCRILLCDTIYGFQKQDHKWMSGVELYVGVREYVHIDRSYGYWVQDSDIKQDHRLVSGV